MGSLLKSVHKILGLLVRNKKFANLFLIIGRHGDEASLLFSFVFLNYLALTFILTIRSEDAQNKI